MTLVLATAPGAATAANSVPVVIASDQSIIPVSDGSGSLTVDGAVVASQSTPANLKAEVHQATGASWDVNIVGATITADVTVSPDMGVYPYDATTRFPVVGDIQRVAVEETRPADTVAYTARDVVSNNATTTVLMTFAGAGRVNGGSGWITKAELFTDQKACIAEMIVHLYATSDPTVGADNVAMKALYADAGKYIGRIVLPALATEADGTNTTWAYALYNALMPYVCAAGATSIYALLETKTAFTPASGQKFTLVLYFDRN